MSSFLSQAKDFIIGDNPEKSKAFYAALIQSVANGFFYGYSVFSTRLRNLVGISSAEVVLLGVLSQAGLGVFQYPTTLVMTKAHKYGISFRKLDFYVSLWSGFLFVASVCGIGAILYLCEQGNAPDPSTSMIVLGICFWMWGQGAGTSFNACSTVVNFNNAGDNRRRRRQLVVLSFAIGLGGVLAVVIYEFIFKDNAALSSFLFGLGVTYVIIMLIRIKWMTRVGHKNVAPATDQSTGTLKGPSRPPSEEDIQEQHIADVMMEEDDYMQRQSNGAVVVEPARTPVPPPVPAPAERITPQPLSALLKSDVVWLTSLGTFLGVGVGGTFLSSTGNLGSQIDPSADLSFSLTLMFLALQTGGRLTNAVIYGYGDWPYIFAFWHAFCLIGICIFLITPTPTGAFISSAFVGMSFGGFHSSFPILAATSFPGNPTVDYSQSVGFTYFVSSIGAIAVGQITTVVYNAASIADLAAHGFFGSFLFFVSLLVVSTLSAVLLGKRIRRNRKKAALRSMQQHDPETGRPASMASAGSVASHPSFLNFNGPSARNSSDDMEDNNVDTISTTNSTKLEMAMV